MRPISSMASTVGITVTRIAWSQVVNL